MILAQERQSLSFMGSLALICILALQRSYPLALEKLSTKTSFITVCLFTFFVYNSYAALLTSSMILRPTETKIESYEDLLSRGYKVKQLW